MADFGQELRAERERRGVSVERLCAETKVNARHFVALEVGDYLTLPGGVFRRGIVRAYLQALGLDEEEWLPRFQASIDAYAGSSKTGLETNADAWVEFAENVRKSRPGRKNGTGLRWLGVLLLLVLIAGAAWAIWRFVVLPHG